jgi:hypothetical protein
MAMAKPASSNRVAHVTMAALPARPTERDDVIRTAATRCFPKSDHRVRWHWHPGESRSTKTRPCVASDIGNAPLAGWCRKNSAKLGGLRSVLA